MSMFDIQKSEKLIIGVRMLKDLWKENSLCFGNKANALSLVMKWGGCVLPGFCITFDLTQEYDNQIQRFSIQIEQAYQNLMNDRGNCRVIVRSSVDIEDSEKARFPGVFRSVSGVTTLPELYQSIKSCLASIELPIVKHYTQATTVTQTFRYFTILVQEELDSQYSGLATTRIPIEEYAEHRIMLASMVRGSNHELVKGVGPSNTYSFGTKANGFHTRKIAGTAMINGEDRNVVLRRLDQELTQLRQKARRELEVEWGYFDGKIYIFQIYFIPGEFGDEVHSKASAITSFSSDADQGFKYQAMLFFQEHGLFPRKTLFFPRHFTAEEIAQAICTQKLVPPITIRFSKGGEIGLPRAFTPDNESAGNYVRKVKQPDWSVIVYSSISVRESFELYIDSDVAILERVPGMWESDSALTADTVVLTQDKARFWLASQPRCARFEDEKGMSSTIVSPSSFKHMKEEVSHRILVIRKLRKLFSCDLPLNFHFVSDGKQDYFLNCRRTHHISWENRYGGSIQRVESVADCRRWDGKSAILFRPKLQRGEELFLFQFVPFLRNLSVPVFVEFGILSHPAIMLREMGIPVVPYFLYHDYFEISLEEI